MPRRGRPSRLFASLVVFVMVVSSGILVQSTGKQAVGASAVVSDDPDFARAVKEWTTRPEFSSPLVDHLPKVSGVPSPNDVLGHHIGEPKKLTYYADTLKYFRALAGATSVEGVPVLTSPRLGVERLRSVLGLAT